MSHTDDDAPTIFCQGAIAEWGGEFYFVLRIGGFDSRAKAAQFAEHALQYFPEAVAKAAADCFGADAKAEEAGRLN